MKIGLWSDAVNFPNIPLMKLSTHHKQLGDVVELVEENGNYDKVYLSKTFNLPLLKKIPQYPPPFHADEIIKGGTGYSIKIENGKEFFDKDTHLNLPHNIEIMCPDYSLYPQYSEAYGFLTRGCCNNCSFCLVTQKEGACSKRVAELSDFHRGQREIKLLDPNLLACVEREKLLQELINSKSSIDFTQGLDARFITDDIAKMINEVKIKTIHFAFDFMRNEKQIIEGLKCFKRHYDGSFRNLKCYVLTNYDTTLEEDWYRVRILSEMGYTPYVMIYQKGTHPRFLTDLARWSNSMYLKRSCSFEEYVPRKDGQSCKELYPQILKIERKVIMATTKKTAETTTVDTATLNVWQKLLAARIDFLGLGVKKSGINTHAEFKYFELEDIVPVATEIFSKYNCLFITTFPDGKATGTLINLDNTDETVTVGFTSRSIAEPGKFRMNEVQGLGAEITYMRRYLYFLILDVVESDKIDSGAGETPTAPVKERKKPATPEKREEIKQELTAPEANADNLQIGALKSVLKKLKEIDPAQEDFIQQIALKTDGFTKIAKSKCEELILHIGGMIENYNLEDKENV